MSFNQKLQRCTLSLIKRFRLVGVESRISSVSLLSQQCASGRYMSSVACYDQIPRAPHPTWNGHTMFTCGLHTTTYFRDSGLNSINEINSEVHFTTDDAGEIAANVTSTENADVVFQSWADDPANIQLITDGLHFDFPSETMWHLGLGSGLSPVGWVQNTIEMFNLGTGIPWFAAVAAATCFIRFCLLPVIQRGLIVETKLKALGIYQLDPYERDRVMAENRINGRDFAKLPLCHAIVWYSFYSGINQMIAAPVSSMTTGGYQWFIDITVPDPLFVLPAVATITSLCTLYIWNGRGIFSAVNLMSVSHPKKVIAGSAIMGIASLCPAAFLSFWITSNFLSIGQALIMKYPGGRRFLGIRDEHTKKLKLLKDL